ncbi:MAG: hypothetical protein M3081_22705 [Gemmatimonadota bacterium]|nr:hypothetical protein [Gemmatimonadota bacterium]
MRSIPPAFLTTAIAGTAMILGCSGRDAPQSAGAGGSASAALATAPAAATTPDITPVRGTIASVDDSTLNVTTATGDVRVRAEKPLHIYARQPSDLAHVTEHSFVGVTSDAQPDGGQRATEIHIFPEAVRGTGEGSNLMAQAAGDTGRRTMTNGTVGSAPLKSSSVILADAR